MESRRILVADDEVYIRELVKAKLTSLGHQVLEAANGREALELATRERPDLALLDIMMPELDGLETLAALRAHAATRELPVIFLSQKRREEDVLRGLELGAVDYLTKPFSPRELAARIRIFLDLRPAAEAATPGTPAGPPADGVGTDHPGIARHGRVAPGSASHAASAAGGSHPAGSVDLISMLRATKMLSADLPLDTKLGMIVNLASIILGSRHISIRPRSASLGAEAAWIGLDPEFLAAERAEVLTRIGWDASPGSAAIHVGDVAAHPSLAGSALLGARGFRSLACYPLHQENEYWGSLAVYFEAPREFPPHERGLLALIAEIAALAVASESLARSSRASVEHLRLFLAHAPSPVFLLDRDGTILHASDSAARAIDLPPDALPGRGLHEIAPFPTLFEGRAAFIEATAALEPGSDELAFQVPWQGGRWRLALRAQAAECEPALVGIFVPMDRGAARQVAATDGEFVLAIAHELQVPLTALHGFSEFLLDGDLAPDERDRYLRIIHRESARLSRVLRDLSETLRLRVGATELRLGPTDLRAVLEEVLELLQPLLGRHDIALVEPERVPLIRADRERLKEVFINLVDNAVKYTPAGGSIRLRLAGADGAARIEVADTGVGMPEDEAAHAFDPFYRGRMRSSSAQGSGLGLTFAREIIAAHGGTITLTSAPGRGTTVSITLPCGSSSPG